MSPGISLDSLMAGQGGAPAAPKPPVAPAPTQTPSAPAAPSGAVQQPAAQPAQQPAAGQPPKGWEKILTPEGLARIKFRDKTVELTPEEFARRAQIGTSAEELDRAKREFQETRRQNEDMTRAGQLLAQFAQQDPEGYRAIQEIIAGRRPPAAMTRGESNLLRDDDEAPTMSPEVERRLSNAERTAQQAMMALQQRDQEARLEKAMRDRPYLRSNPKAAELAQSLARAAMSQGDSPDNAAMYAEATIREIVTDHLENERREREARRETAAPAAVSRGLGPMPRADWKGRQPSHRGATQAEDRNVLLDLMRKMGQVVSGP